jgi:hypothetical protein
LAWSEVANYHAYTEFGIRLDYRGLVNTIGIGSSSTEMNTLKNLETHHKKLNRTQTRWLLLRNFSQQVSAV